MQIEHLNGTLPKWIPDSVARYVAHTEQGVPIREIARRDGCHASTVLRQIRKLETMRDDPMVDAALNHFRARATATGTKNPAQVTAVDVTDMPRARVLRGEAQRVLGRLCETGAVLAVSEAMETAVVVRDGGGEATRTASVSKEIVEAMALKDWISCTNSGRVLRYTITPMGRTALSEFVAEAENSASGFSDAQAGFAPSTRPCQTTRKQVRTGPQRVRFNMAESPLVALSRRRDKSGAPFLSGDLVGAGERLREDYELAQMAPQIGTNWARFLAAPSQGTYRPDTDVASGQEAARARVVDALGYLGEGLCEIVLRCCCFLEGLEAAERQLGWSARSAKIVLRIALMRLREYYHDNAGGAGDYIG